jgi:hypothetical protein
MVADFCPSNCCTTFTFAPDASRRPVRVPDVFVTLVVYGWGALEAGGGAVGGLGRSGL